jgi:NAD(P)-dependent dehydrogenase (short-subunit alcohol dehydrogenase family)
MKRGRTKRAWGWMVPAGAYVGWRLYKTFSAPALRGRVVLITGGSRGLGLALARELARHGCRIALCARDEQELRRAQLDLERLGAEVAAFRCDVADRERVEELVAAVQRRFGKLEMVVNNAGVIQVGPFDAMTPGDFERAMAVNFWGPLNVIWAALPALRECSGQIVNITSIGAVISMPHILPYGSAKAAFLSLSEGLRSELGRHGVTVTTVIPGLMRTGSPVNASFKGNAEREFEWFSTADQHRLTSTSVERAARLIVAAAKRREGRVVLSWQAKLAWLAHALAPNLVSEALSTFNGLLPRERGLRFEARRGQELTTPGAAPSSLRRRLEETARRLNQYGEAPPPDTETDTP